MDTVKSKEAAAAVTRTNSEGPAFKKGQTQPQVSSSSKTYPIKMMINLETHHLTILKWCGCLFFLTPP